MRRLYYKEQDVEVKTDSSGNIPIILYFLVNDNEYSNPLAITKWIGETFVKMDGSEDQSAITRRWVKLCADELVDARVLERRQKGTFKRKPKYVYRLPETIFGLQTILGGYWAISTSLCGSGYADRIVQSNLVEYFSDPNNPKNSNRFNIREDALKELITLIPVSRTAMQAIFSSNIRFPIVKKGQSKDNVFTDFIIGLMVNGLSIDLTNTRISPNIEQRLKDIVETSIDKITISPELTLIMRTKETHYSPLSVFNVNNG